MAVVLNSRVILPPGVLTMSENIYACHKVELATALLKAEAIDAGKPAVVCRTDLSKKD